MLVSHCVHTYVSVSTAGRVVVCTSGCPPTCTCWVRRYSAFSRKGGGRQAANMRTCTHIGRAAIPPHTLFLLKSGGLIALFLGAARGPTWIVSQNSHHPALPLSPRQQLRTAPGSPLRTAASTVGVVANESMYVAHPPAAVTAPERTSRLSRTMVRDTIVGGVKVEWLWLVARFVCFICRVKIMRCCSLGREGRERLLSFEQYNLHLHGSSLSGRPA